MFAKIDEVKTQVVRRLDLLREEMTTLARQIHSKPEIGYQEHEASQLLVDFLKRHGFDARSPIAGMETAFLATSSERPGGSRVAILAEYDALPGLGHACGHNLIGTAAAGAGIAAASSLSGTDGGILVLGCPAEEACVDGAGGKVRLIQAGCFRDVDAALIFHPMPLTAVGGETSALAVLNFEFKGKAAHAAGNPWDGRNALDGVLLTFGAINALRQHTRDGIRLHGIVTHGGDAPNIVPEYAAARFFVRSPSTEDLNQTLPRVESCARGAAMATGTDVVISRAHHTYEAMRTNAILAGIIQRNLEKVGLRIEGRKKGKGSTDFGNVSRVTPACELSIRLGDGIAPHTREFLEAANSDEGIEVMMLGAKVMAMTALDLLMSPEVLKTAKSEFQGTLA